MWGAGGQGSGVWGDQEGRRDLPPNLIGRRALKEVYLFSVITLEKPVERYFSPD